MIEKKINGRPDIIVKNKGKRIAVEIETGMSDWIGNIKRALKANFDEVICIATNRHVADKIENDLKNKVIMDDKIKVTCVLSYDIS